MSQSTGSKRLACDRCRASKVRCRREDSVNGQSNLANGPCGRCLRAGAHCVTSSARPSGRPRNHNDRESTEDTRSIPNPSINGPRKRATRKRSVPSHSDSAAASPPDKRAPNSEIQPDPSSSYNNFLNISDPMIGAAVPEPNLLSWDQQSDMANPLILQLSDEDYDSAQFAAHLFQPHQNEDLPVADAHFVFSAAPLVDDGLAAEAPVHTDESTTDEPSVMIRLCRLNEDLAQQLKSLDAYTWEQPLAQSVCISKANSLSGNPIAQALKTTADLGSILAGIASSTTPSGRVAPDPSSSSSERILLQSFKTPIMMQILSAHLLLLQLYDEIFSRAYESLQTVTRHTIAAFEAPGAVSITGLPRIKGDLLIKIMVQTIQHELKRIEALIGLPHEFCVVAGDDARVTDEAAGGLISKDTKMVELVKLVVGQMSDGTTGIARATSLRLSMDKVMGYLEEA